MTMRKPPKSCRYCKQPTGNARKLICEGKECRDRHRSEAHLRGTLNIRDRRIAAGEETVTCAICQKPLLGMSYGHLLLHGSTMADYSARFPDAATTTAAIRHARGKAQRARSGYLNFDGKPLDDVFFAFLAGALLGDGSLEPLRHNARYAEGGSNERYIRWKYELMAQYLPVKFKEKLSSPHTKSGKRYLGWWLRSGVHPELTKWRALWYPCGSKIVPFDLLRKYASPLTLAVWFCDDGHRSSGKCGSHGAHLYTHSFKKQEVEELVRWLFESFGVEASVRKAAKHKEQYLIYIGAAARPKLLSVVRSISPDGMDYKYHERNSDHSRSAKTIR